MRAEDLTGKTFNRLLVKEFYGIHTYPSGKTRRLWKCVCLNDGNEVIAKANELKNGHIQSCGCLNQEKRSERRFIDLSGQTLNNIEVIKRIGTRQFESGTSSPYYLCKCLVCGKYFEMPANHLRDNDNESCGCLLKKREAEIENCLLHLGVDYVRELSFLDNVSSKGVCLRYDFAIFGNDGILRCIVEEHGIQHLHSYGYMKEKYEQKDNYCKIHNIPLEIIWFNEDIKSRVDEICNKYLHANPVPSLYKEGPTTISKESTRLVKFQRGSAALRLVELDEDIV